MKHTILTIVLYLAALTAHAAEKIEIPDEHRFGPLLGKRVTLDALVWHYTKGLSGRVVLPSGRSVYVRDSNVRQPNGTLKQRLPQGKLVRLVGVLTFEHIPPSPPDEQGYPAGASYFALALESFAPIEVAEEAFPQLISK
jgi:hypothetical protein